MDSNNLHRISALLYDHDSSVKSDNDSESVIMAGEAAHLQLNLFLYLIFSNVGARLVYVSMLWHEGIIAPSPLSVSLANFINGISAGKLLMMGKHRLGTACILPVTLNNLINRLTTSFPLASFVVLPFFLGYNT